MTIAPWTSGEPRAPRPKDELPDASELARGIPFEVIAVIIVVILTVTAVGMRLTGA